MEWNIQLMTRKLDQWMTDAEQKFTRVRDLLDVLEAEEDTLKKAWKSSAMEQWEWEFQLLIAKLRTQLKEMQKLMVVLDEAADRLAQVEKDMLYDAEKL
ncbi:MAG: hypothetical protein K2N15_04425 [Lachnospiraceae bacterium]|nr:hypothetical protein [Lachnospiraceae bacterium]